ncbi:hypothetical protein L915_13039 [Phytophthora nicotianae]|uniref:MULE transposase domain-containing protein n=1 Tax=Phytophthora nicotianae TaxID=4792 RepID=W2GEY5_PHYNI|nr:hypothetical protein L915_13039 [Phytophthora nicotianae]
MLLGCGSKKCRKILQERNAVPDATQPKNLKAHLKSSLATYDAQTFCKNSRDFRHEFLVLECFEHAITTENGTKDSCCRLVVTSRQVFRNVLNAHNGQCSDGIVGVTDGTYRLHYGGWTLVGFGTNGSHYDRTQYSKTFPPWVYVFLAYGSLDRMAGIANAFAEVWPEITLLNCYPHFNR